MGFLKKLLGRGKTELDSDYDKGRVDCDEIIRAIRQRMNHFNDGKGMVLVIQEACRATIYYFNGRSKCSWSYTNQQFSTDRVGETFLESSPEVYAIKINKEQYLAPLIQQSFSDCEVSVNTLWHLNPQAWDYDVMKKLHEHDFGIRISKH